MKENIHKIFENWNETIIWSCLQGIMGEIHTNLSENAAMAILGDFAFFSGNPDEELRLFRGNGGLKTSTTPVFIWIKQHSTFG